MDKISVVDNWNVFNSPKPYFVVSGIAVDPFGRFPLLKRSDKVRSAKNAWSLPSGLHEPGLTAGEQFAQELLEELNLTADPATAQPIGLYENIRPEGLDLPGWHWVIVVMAIQVQSLDSLINREADKHSEIEIVTPPDSQYDWVSGKTWASGLDKFIADKVTLINDLALFRRASSVLK